MQQLILSGILLLFWIALTQSFYWLDLILGLFISILSLFISKKFLSSHSHHSYIRLDKVIKYILVLFPHIICSGLKSIYKMLTFQTDVKIIRVRTRLDNNFLIYLLAVSITLTPGTITIYRRKNTLYVLRLFPQAEENEDEAESIKAPFEKLLMGVRR